MMYEEYLDRVGELVDDLASVRSAELEEAAAVLGVHRLVALGYPDSGLDGEVVHGFASADRFAVARRIAAVLDEEHAARTVGAYGRTERGDCLFHLGSDTGL